MELFVYSRDALARVTPNEVPHVVISITTTPGDVARFPVPPTCLAVLRLSFADLLPTEVDASTRHHLFSRAQAERIWSFWDQHRARIERLLVHCDAGHSRSPAIAAAIAEDAGLEHESFFRRYEPNAHVLETMRASRLRGT
jgi:predicted protein tyrosine phosphatase